MHGEYVKRYKEGYFLIMCSEYSAVSPQPVKTWGQIRPVLPTREPQGYK